MGAEAAGVGSKVRLEGESETEREGEGVLVGFERERDWRQGR